MKSRQFCVCIFCMPTVKQGISQGDPAKDAKAMRNTEIVFKNGIGFDSKKLFESVKGKVGLY